MMAQQGAAVDHFIIRCHRKKHAQGISHLPRLGSGVVGDDRGRLLIDCLLRSLARLDADP
jgi:hypothetical protein